MILLWAMLSLAWAGAGDAHLAQAQLFAKKRWYQDAADELDLALQTPEGQRSFEAWWLSAQVGFELDDIDRALDSARQARAVAPDEATRARATALVDSYEQGFGFLTVQAPYPGMASRLQLEFHGMVFDPELKHYINRAALAWRQRTPLPARVGLPVGSYEINGQTVEVAPGQEAQVELPMSAIGSRGMAALQVTRAELSAGLGFFTGPDVADLLPGPDLQLSISQPIGPVLVGAFAEVADLRFYSPDRLVQRASPAWTGGLRVGFEPSTRLPLAIRPSLTLRYAQVPGIARDCAQTDGWICHAPDPALPAELRLYAVGWAIAPGAELSLQYREAGRTTALGTGFKFGLDHAIGNFASSPQAWTYDHPDVDWTPSDEGWTATGVHLLADLSLAF